MATNRHARIREIATQLVNAIRTSHGRRGWIKRSAIFARRAMGGFAPIAEEDAQDALLEAIRENKRANPPRWLKSPPTRKGIKIPTSAEQHSSTHIPATMASHRMANQNITSKKPVPVPMRRTHKQHKMTQSWTNNTHSQCKSHTSDTAPNMAWAPHGENATKSWRSRKTSTPSRKNNETSKCARSSYRTHQS